MRANSTSGLASARIWATSEEIQAHYYDDPQLGSNIVASHEREAQPILRLGNCGIDHCTSGRRLNIGLHSMSKLPRHPIMLHINTTPFKAFKVAQTPHSPRSVAASLAHPAHHYDQSSPHLYPTLADQRVLGHVG